MAITPLSLKEALVQWLSKHLAFQAVIHNYVSSVGIFWAIEGYLLLLNLLNLLPQEAEMSRIPKKVKSFWIMFCQS